MVVAAIGGEVIVECAEFVQHVAEFVEDQDCAGRDERIEARQTKERRRVEIAVDVDDERRSGFERLEKRRQTFLKQAADEMDTLIRSFWSSSAGVEFPLGIILVPIGEI